MAFDPFGYVSGASGYDPRPTIDAWPGVNFGGAFPGIHTQPNPNYMPYVFSPQQGQLIQGNIAQQQANLGRSNTLTQLLTNLMGGLTGSPGSGKVGAGGGVGNIGGGTSGDLSPFMNLFDLARERAHRGLGDLFTQAGGAENLSCPFSNATAELERGLGQTEQGSIVDLQTRMQGPLIQLLLGLLSSVGRA